CAIPPGYCTGGVCYAGGNRFDVW
nr:immunoglobulin heavy chain junction region [Macaca mulatta]